MAVHKATLAPEAFSISVARRQVARGLQILPAASATQVTYLGSSLGIIIGVLLGDEWPKLRVWLGGIIILCALQVAERTEATEVGNRVREDKTEFLFPVVVQ